MGFSIVGTGNIGTKFAVYCAEKHHEVYIYTGKADRIQKHLEMVNEEG